MIKKIAVLKGDGIGPEVVNQAILVLKTIGETFGHTFTFTEGLIGAVAYEKTGEMLPGETLKLCDQSDAVLFGTIGDPAYDHLRPEKSLLQLRKHLGLYSNVRPICSFPALINASPLKASIIQNVDFVIVRELSAGLYYGKRGKTKTRAFDTCTYTKKEILRVTEFAFNLALSRRRKVTLVDKANVLDTSRLWREVVTLYAKRHPTVALEFMYVDNAAMQIIKRPSSFDVILTDNMFGDILSDESSMICGSLGLLPSASIGEKASLFEPIHGSYPKARGTNTANPTGTILSAAMMLGVSFSLHKEHDAIYQAVQAVLDRGFATKDISTDNPITTTEFGSKVCMEIKMGN
jgi:3-isopropylmalate dehydrogenase